MSLRTLRLALGFIALECVLLGYLMAFLPQWFLGLFYIGELDSLHRALGMSLGALLFALAAGAGIAAMQPRKHIGLIIVLALTHLFAFIADIIALSRGMLPVTIVLPSMVIEIALFVLLIRYFPAREKLAEAMLPVEEKPLEESPMPSEVAPQDTTPIVEEPSGMDGSDVDLPTFRS